MLRHSKGASWDLHLGRDGWEGLPLARTCGAAAPARNTGMAQNANAAQARHADQAGRAGGVKRQSSPVALKQQAEKKGIRA